MYFVDQQKITAILDYMDSILEELHTRKSYDTFMETRALERMTQMLIESVLDVGNLMIDGFIMRDPGGFDDIIDILVDENVLPQHEQAPYKAIIHLRKMVVKDYLSVDHASIYHTLSENKAILDAFRTHITTYLENEVGAPNAFMNND